jgi:heme/copper-type cytochrome/quinol oxidase subunit 2
MRQRRNKAKEERNMDPSGPLWSIITIAGPLILVAVIAWAALRNRNAVDTREETERATRALYEEEDRAHRGEDDDVP